MACGCGHRSREIACTINNPCCPKLHLPRLGIPDLRQDAVRPHPDFSPNNVGCYMKTSPHVESFPEPSQTAQSQTPKQGTGLEGHSTARAQPHPRASDKSTFCTKYTPLPPFVKPAIDDAGIRNHHGRSLGKPSWLMYT